MALPALMPATARPTVPTQRWLPGDPIHLPPSDPETDAERAIAARLRHGGGRAWEFRYADAIPAPFGWLCGAEATGSRR